MSAAVYVLAGSRLETREQAGVAHFMEHVTFKGTRGVPDDARRLRGDRGLRRIEQRGHRSRVDRLLGARPDARRRARLQRAGRADRSAAAARGDIARERDIIVEEIRSYRDDPGQYVFNLFDRAFFGDTPLGWEIAGDEERASVA